MLSSNTWLTQSLIGMLLVVPAWLSIPFFAKNFNIRGDIFLLWYMVGMVLGTCLLMFFGRTPLRQAVPSAAVIGGIIVVGIFFGALANGLVFKAVTIAPNPGVPIAIASISSSLVFIISLVLGLFFPKYFAAIKFNLYHLVGIALILAGISLIAIKK